MATEPLPVTDCWVPELLVLELSALVAEPLAVELVVDSPPPNSGDRWLRETCSMKDVPYFLKYHHSKIWKIEAQNERLDGQPRKETGQSTTRECSEEMAEEKNANLQKARNSPKELGLRNQCIHRWRVKKVS